MVIVHVSTRGGGGCRANLTLEAIVRKDQVSWISGNMISSTKLNGEIDSCSLPQLIGA